jgi:hypothetical protein
MAPGISQTPSSAKRRDVKELSRESWAGWVMGIAFCRRMNGGNSCDYFPKKLPFFF